MISGLGADERVYQYFKFECYSLVHIKWIQLNSESTLKNYVHEISKQITDLEPVIIGISFGGIVAQELGSIFPNSKIIIINSICTQSELRFLYRNLGTFIIYKSIISILRNSIC
ncbi:MAG: hypothetical protein U0V72_10965 [Cytophagales bacterium]